MASTFVFPSAYNGYIPAVSNQVIGYIKKQEEFKLNGYVQYVPSAKNTGLYAKLERDAFIRRTSDEENAWEDGAKRPDHANKRVRYKMEEYRCFRRDYGWTLGKETLENSDMQLKPIHMDMAISECMTNRTIRVINMLENTSNWGTHYATATELNDGAGGWRNASDDPNSPAYFAFGKSLIRAMRLINKATNGRVGPKDLRLILSPEDAEIIGQTAEIVQFMRNSQYVKQQQEDPYGAVNEMWGLPRIYKGLEIIVEDAVYIDSFPTSAGDEVADSNRLYVKSSGSAIICSRKGGIDGVYGAPSFSTMQVFHYGGLVQIAAFSDAKNELVEGHVNETIAEKMTSEIAGYLITDTL